MFHSSILFTYLKLLNQKWKEEKENKWVSLQPFIDSFILSLCYFIVDSEF